MTDIRQTLIDKAKTMGWKVTQEMCIRDRHRGAPPHGAPIESSWSAAGAVAVKQVLLWLIRFYRSAISPRCV